MSSSSSDQTIRGRLGRDEGLEKYVPGLSAADAFGGGIWGGLFTGLTRYQLELWALSSRRAQAYMELSSKVARCKSPQELLNVQSRFIEKSSKQYADSGRRLSSVLTQAMTPSAELSQPIAPEQNPVVLFSKGKADPVVETKTSISRERVRPAARQMPALPDQSEQSHVA
ncbi:MAG: phasin family protein [Pseudomonadota bacterium]